MTTTVLIHAPWTPEQVRALVAWQNDPDVHPYTCVYRNPATHVVGGVHGDLGVLVPTTDGLVCFDCSYNQTWALPVSLGPRPVSGVAVERAWRQLKSAIEHAHVENMKALDDPAVDTTECNRLVNQYRQEYEALLRGGSNVAG